MLNTIPILLSITAIVLLDMSRRMFLSESFDFARIAETNTASALLTYLSFVIAFFMRPKQDYKKLRLNKTKALLQIVHRAVALSASLYGYFLCTTMHDGVGKILFFPLLFVSSFLLVRKSVWARSFWQAAEFNVAQKFSIPMRFFGVHHVRIAKLQVGKVAKIKFRPPIGDWIFSTLVLGVPAALGYLLVPQVIGEKLSKETVPQILLVLLMLLPGLFIFRNSILRRMGSITITPGRLRFWQALKQQDYDRWGTRRIAISSDSSEFESEGAEYGYSVHYKYYVGVYGYLKGKGKGVSELIAIEAQDGADAELVADMLNQVFDHFGWLDLAPESAS